jgi:hypothetical protein
MSENLFWRNGIDPDTGNYLSRPLTEHEIADLAFGQPLAESLVSDLERRHEVDHEISMGLRQGLEARDLAQAGWGVIFAADDPKADAIRNALEPLLIWRKEQATRRFAHFYQEYSLEPGISKSEFLESHNAGAGAADPDDVPYYLLIAASPGRISYQFQYELDVQYAVGRLYFDRVEDYRIYAESVVAAERAAETAPRRAVFFGVENPNDLLSEISCRKLVQPMSEQLESHAGWTVQGVLGAEATKDRLARLLGGNETPSLLLTAGHGIGYAPDPKSQRQRQGALVCSDWRGPGFGGRPCDYFGASDLPARARLQGLISFHFACYSAGTPQEDELSTLDPETTKTLARRPFVARLPQRMLARRRGALAVVGHIDRSWDAPRHLNVFVDAFKLLMEGYPVGAAIDVINSQHAALAVELVELMRKLYVGKIARNDTALRKAWTGTYDTKAYAVVGDPAVRVPGSWTAPS